MLHVSSVVRAYVRSANVAALKTTEYVHADDLYFDGLCGLSVRRGTAVRVTKCQFFFTSFVVFGGLFVG